MKKFILSLAVLVIANHILAQTGMLNFQQDLSGAPSGNGVPIDGGLSAMIVGSAVYGYRMMKKRKKNTEK